jgi:predicted alpha/beta superfamily hydrolase
MILPLLLTSLATASAVKVSAFYPGPVFFPGLSLRGDACGLSWEKGLPMTRASEQSPEFTIEVDCPLTVKSFEFKVLAGDATWELGSNHYFSVERDGSNRDVYPWFNSRSGDTSTIIKNVYSKELNNTRDVIFYMPPSYYENTLKKYSNVLIMHDGQNLFNKQTAYMGNAWMCQDSLDTSIIGGTSDEVLVVGAYNTADRMDEYTYVYDPSEQGGGKGDLYLDWIESTLLPLVTQHFPRVEVKRDTLGILGSSLGGLISCYAGVTRPEVYGRVGCMSSSFWWDENDFQKVILPATTPLTPLNHVYMDSGTGSVGEKECGVYTSDVYNQLVGEGYEEEKEVWKYVDEGATHSESYWGPRFHLPIEALYPSTTV